MTSPTTALSVISAGSGPGRWVVTIALREPVDRLRARAESTNGDLGLTTVGRRSPHLATATTNKELSMIKLMITFVIVFLIATFPATWLLMLFLGNVGVNLGYWGALPLGILVSSLIGGASASTY